MGRLEISISPRQAGLPHAETKVPTITRLQLANPVFARATSQPSNKLHLKAPKSPCAALTLRLPTWTLDYTHSSSFWMDVSSTNWNYHLWKASFSLCSPHHQLKHGSWLMKHPWPHQEDGFLNSYRKKLAPDQEEQWYHPRSSHTAQLNLTAEYLQKPKRILYNKKGNEVYFLRGTNYILTGPIIVACQWNTESQKDKTIREFSELFHNQKKASGDKVLWGAYSHLQQARRSSEPVGLAAGHSVPIRNTRIFVRHPHEKKHHSAAPLQTRERKQTLLNRPAAFLKKSTLEMSIDTERHFLPDRSAAKDNIVL